MSEFKYACPVCGQHMMCDSSQSGTTMECPTCFQKIVAPQAPATDDPKFIITGTKVGAERPIPAAVANADAPPAPVPEKASYWPVLALGALVCVVAVVLVAFHGKIFKSGSEPIQTAANPPGGPPPAKPPKPPVVAPPANDANWMLDLSAAAFVDTPVAGRIHGLDFICERAIFQGGTLTLRTGTHGTVDFGVLINFKNALAESLSGQSINVTTNADKAANVMLRWQADGQQKKENFDDSYAMRLDFGELTGNRLPGKIYLCTPDAEKSYLLGTFAADVRKPKPPKPK